MAVTESMFMKLMLACQLLVKNFYTDFKKVYLLILCHRQMAGWLHEHGHHVRHSFFFTSYKCLKLVAKLVKELLVYSQLMPVAFIWV